MIIIYKQAYTSKSYVNAHMSVHIRVVICHGSYNGQSYANSHMFDHIYENHMYVIICVIIYMIVIYLKSYTNLSYMRNHI